MLICVFFYSTDIYIHISFCQSFYDLSVVYLGPYSLNGVPLRRVNQRYVIATNTKVDMGGVDASKIDDALFAREASESTKEDMEKLYAAGEHKTTYTSAARKSAQTSVDSALSKNIEKVEMLSAYMKAKFSLSKGDMPHLMKF